MAVELGVVGEPVEQVVGIDQAQRAGGSVDRCAGQGVDPLHRDFGDARELEAGVVIMTVERDRARGETQQQLDIEEAVVGVGVAAPALDVEQLVGRVPIPGSRSGLDVGDRGLFGHQPVVLAHCVDAALAHGSRRAPSGGEGDLVDVDAAGGGAPAGEPQARAQLCEHDTVADQGGVGDEILERHRHSSIVRLWRSRVWLPISASGSPTKTA